MKPITKILAAAAVTAALGACDDIKEGDRYIDVPAAMVERTVLLEDFTGQNCTNCPAAHRAIEALEAQYGEHLVAVSIHAGNFGISADNTRYTGLMQPEGNTYNDRYGIVEYPQGVVDGHRPTLDFDQWATAVYNEIQISTPLSIGLTAVERAGEVTVGVDLQSGEALSGDLVVWMVESGIVARQEDADAGRINDYVHNNVFRACVNGVDGEGVSVSPGTAVSRSYTIAVRETPTEKWNVANLAAVAFVKNGSGVLQAARCAVTPLRAEE